MKLEHKAHTNVDVTAYQQKKNGNERCGDAYITIETDQYFLCALADGLGSGAEAHRSAQLAMNVITEAHDQSVSQLLDQCNQVLFQERGVVLTMLKVDFATQEIMYGNIGNVECILMLDNDQIVRPVPAPGYLSSRKYKYRLERFQYGENVRFLLYSDGTVFSPECKNMMSAAKSPECVVNRLAEAAQSANDDVTIVGGDVS
ncbi:SpoIIE family protein phosphatase [Salsuginibacillus kocurii]|uniref:SpoIIE family protein phosphatase n=1 Tax=Salsuginibacillus kocurii TaxID=427078 RepID=UPI00035ED27F|nr:SpoIIE family protein phosphatase [Salsuginibacillus kocurii]